MRGQVALFRGRHERAAEAAATAIELDPNYADAYALLAWILHYAGRPDQAEPALREALRRNPRSSASYREIAGEISFATGRYGKAAKDFEAGRERYAAGLAPMVEVLDAQADLTAADMTQIRARASAWVAEAALHRAVGR